MSTENVRTNARMLAECLTVAVTGGIEVHYATAHDVAHVLMVGTVPDGDRLAARLGATEHTRFGWRHTCNGRSTIIELAGRPEVHPPTITPTITPAG